MAAGLAAMIAMDMVTRLCFFIAIFLIKARRHVGSKFRAVLQVFDL